jgi:hypothetical protein
LPGDSFGWGQVVFIFGAGMYISRMYGIVERVVKTGKERLGLEVEDSKKEFKRSKRRF